ncbi:cytochrome b/b6 domain-containing protein [Anaerolinea sp.]|uniref:cytochrome b/b6 domain-containing protein n=1 Tax=Anaerolinea sp. TaxID=1872519 RepID=UPI002ACDBC73|nr:cytochrome b/b6 domain-containing protein [Anaerolinea sp.]
MSQQTKTYQRFSVAQRIEHFVLILSFTLLALTGLPQKFFFSDISQWIISAFGGIESIRIVHRVAATVFCLQAIYHLVVMGYKLYVLRLDPSMLPSLKDGQDAIQWFLYNLGLRKERPKMPRYNFMEKMEYWAMVWGLVIMALTGFMLWNPIATSRALPGVVIPAAKAAHGAEAILAVLAIILWHFYNVHIKHWNWSMIKGTLSREEMEEEHALELEQIERGALPQRPAPEVIRKRMRVYVPIASVVGLALSAAVIYFITFEQTAITTVQPKEEERQVIVLRSPTPLPTVLPTATPQPTSEADLISGALTWEGSIGKIMTARCGSCHGSLGALNVKNYADLMKGGRSGTVIVPGDPQGSLLIQTVQGGTHPGSFSNEEFQKVIEWIQAGAPEK